MNCVQSLQHQIKIISQINIRESYEIWQNWIGKAKYNKLEKASRKYTKRSNQVTLVNKKEASKSTNDDQNFKRGIIRTLQPSIPNW